MTQRKTLDQRLDGREARILRAGDRYMERMEPRWTSAEEQIGQLASGKLYVYPVGGKYREGSRAELIDFLIRNNYA